VDKSRLLLVVFIDQQHDSIEERPHCKGRRSLFIPAHSPTCTDQTHLHHLMAAVAHYYTMSLTQSHMKKRHAEKSCIPEQILQPH
jgi:hypothetical protein